MKKHLMIAVIAATLLGTLPSAQAQWVVVDPTRTR